MALINDINSKGLQRLPQYRNSRISQQMYEPLYLNLFTITLTPPDPLKEIYGTDSNEVLMILENIKSVSGINPQPGVDGPMEQTYKWATRSFAGGKPNRTTMDLSVAFQFNVNPDGDTASNFTYKFLRQWFDIIWDPMTGRMGIKREYAADQMVVTIHDRRGVPFHQWIFYNVFPTGGLGEFTLDYNNPGPYESSVTFRADTWDESIL